jgi:sugar lactone lactonase YvrE
MLKSKLALFLLAGLVGAGCADDDDDNSPGDGGGVDDTGPEWTDGASTLSGADEAGYVDGPRGKARFANPVNVAVMDGKLYVADFDNSKLREIDLDSYVTTTIVSQMDFQRPFGLAAAGNGVLYVSTDRNTRREQGPMTGTIWKVNVGAKAATPLAENIGRPRGLAVLPNGMIAFADYQNHVVGLVNPTTGQVTQLAGQFGVRGMADGSGTAAVFDTPYGIVVKGNELIVADYGNHRLRRVGLDGTVGTMAGSGTAGFADGAMVSARFNKPQGLSISQAGDIFVTDADNFRIRKISGTNVTTVAGGQPGFADHDDPLQAKFYGLEGLSVSPDGAWLYVADGGRGENVPYNRVRAVKLQ